MELDSENPCEKEENDMTMQKPLTLGKSCKLRHRSLVEPLFSKGNGVYEYPLRGVWRKMSDTQLTETFCNHVPENIGKLQMLITVPKKKRRHAVDRVYVRRRIREAFRLHRRDFEKLLEDRYPEIRTLSLALVYQSSENLSFQVIEKAMVRLLRKIEKRLAPKDK